MRQQLTLFNYTIIFLILVVILTTNILFLHSPILGLILGLFYLVFYGIILGMVLFPDKDRLFQTLWGPLFLLAGLSLIGAIIYYLWQLNTLIIILLLVVIPLLLGLVIKNLSSFNFPKLRITHYALHITDLLLVIGYLLLVISAFYTLVVSQTTDAVRSPWDVVPWQFFIVYFLATLILLFLISKKFTKYNLILITSHFFLSFSIAWIVYPIGWGFDSFIHQSTEKIIAFQGFITPKPFYYIGQYSLVVLLSKLFQISVSWMDKLLLPILAAIYLPSTIYFASKELPNKLRITELLLVTSYLLLVTYSIFIVTTPQGLANLLILIIIFLGLTDLKLRYLFFLTLTVLFIHPLAGLPALIFIVILSVFKLPINKSTKKIISIPVVLISCIILPLAFYISSLISSQIKVFFNLQNFWNWFSGLIWPVFYWQNKFNLIKNLVYFYGSNLKIWFLLIVAIGVIYLIRKKQLRKWPPYLLVFGIIFINYLILKALSSFKFLITYEQSNYTDRLLEISFYFLIPVFLYTLYLWTQKIWNRPWPRIIWLVFIALLITSSLYFTYPKNDDNYEVSHAFNVSASDIKTVHYIDEVAESNYIVLANQSVSAAAIREFGFKKYFDSIFYYPVPTGSPLYQYYLDMVYKKASRETMREAMNLVGVKEAYFVVNDYWWAWPRIVEQAKKSADDWLTIDNEKIWIFKYQK